jgi:hypothetical protein
MNRYKNYVSAISIAAMVLGLVAFASAQRRNRNDNDYYGRADVNLSYSVKNLKNTSRRFEDALDRELDRSRYDGTAREDNLNSLAKRFRKAADDLEDEFDGRNRGNMNRSSDEARRVISYGSQLDVALSRSRLAYNNFSLQQSWSAIERDLLTISRAYNIRYNGAYGRRQARNSPWGYPSGGNRGPVRTNGRYNGNLRATIVNLKDNAKRFENRIDREWDNNRYGNRNYGGNLEKLSDSFASAADRLEDRYDDRRDYNETYDEVRRVLSIGQQLDAEISRSRVNYSLRSDWNRIESDLRILANAYNIRYNGRNGFSVGDIIRNFPF